MAKEFSKNRRVVLKNHAIDGGHADPSNYITVPKGTTDELAALTRRQGAVAYDTTEASLVVDSGSAFEPVGGSVDFEAVASDILPATDATYDIGSVTERYVEVHAQQIMSVEGITSPEDSDLIVKGSDVSSGGGLELYLNGCTSY
jgi:hypothetical protein